MAIPNDSEIDMWVCDVFVLCLFRKCKDRLTCPDYYKNVLARACGGAAILGVFTLFTLYLNRKRRSVRTI